MNNTSEGRDVRLEIRIDASPETVFALLTERTQMKTWLAAVVEADAWPGGAFRISGPSGAAVEGTYFEVVPKKESDVTWGGAESF
jgi:uncharacterized protein YndB with AHSA1/START domain